MRLGRGVLTVGVIAVVLGSVVLGQFWELGDLIDPGCDGEPSGPAALVSVDARTGDLLWSRTVGNTVGMGSGDGAVAVMGGAGVLRGFDASTGEMNWCREIEGALESGVYLNFAAAGTIVAAYSGEQHITAFDLSTGRERWRVPISTVAARADSPTPTFHFESSLRLIGGDALWVTAGDAAETIQMQIEPETGRVVTPQSPDSAALASLIPIDTAAGMSLHDSTPREYVAGRQERNFTLVDIDADVELWSRTVPGYLLALAETDSGEAVALAIDQTGGTGSWPGPNETLLSAYESTDGSLRWQREVPLHASDLHPGAVGAVIVTSDAEILAVSADTGDTIWTKDHGSPGRQRPYTVVGSYRDFVYMPSVDAYVGLIVAERPYRD